MAELRIPIILNKGRKGIPLQKPARISYELQQFLSLLGEDLQIQMGSLLYCLVNQIIRGKQFESGPRNQKGLYSATS